MVILLAPAASARAAALDVTSPADSGAAQPPTILAASDREVAGTAQPGALVTLFAVPAPGSNASFAGAVTADQDGLWELPAAASPGELVEATQTGAAGTSALSASVIATAAAASGPRRSPARWRRYTH